MAIPWFSATFEGLRHELHFDASYPVAPLEPEHLVLPGGDHLVVSVGVEHAQGRAMLSILTIANA